MQVTDSFILHSTVPGSNLDLELLQYLPPHVQNILYAFTEQYIFKGKGEVIPLQARCGPEGG